MTEPGKADIAVVLAGDYWGHRLFNGAELVKQGYVPLVLVSGPPGFYGVNEADAAIQFAVDKDTRRIGSSRCITRRFPPAKKRVVVLDA